MPRKRIIDTDAAKFSVVVSGKNKRILDNLVQNLNSKYSPMINKIISTICDMNPNIKTIIENAILNEYRRLSKTLENASEPYYIESYKNDIAQCEDILKLLNLGIYNFPKFNFEPYNKRINLSDGYLIIPDDWIVVNAEKASTCRYVFVLEAKNYIKYGVPHFIYFTNSDTFTNDMEQDFRSLCRKHWSDFNTIEKIEKENELITDPANPSGYANMKEYLESPIIGIFPIGEVKTDSDSLDMPFGAKIVRA